MGQQTGETCPSASLGIRVVDTYHCALLFIVGAGIQLSCTYFRTSLALVFDVRFSNLFLPLGIVLLKIQVASQSTYCFTGLQNGTVYEYFRLLNILNSKRLTVIDCAISPLTKPLCWIFMADNFSLL